MTISQQLLDILACPKCKQAVRLNPEATAIICDHCRLAYPVQDDIPVMLLDEAVPCRD